MVDTPPTTRRGGRPRKIEGEKRSVPIPVKFSPAERDQLLAEVERYGLPSLSELIRQRALKGKVQVIQREEMSGPDRAELHRVGVNLHQLVKHLNLHGALALSDIEDEARQAVDQINALLLKGGPQ